MTGIVSRVVVGVVGAKVRTPLGGTGAFAIWNGPLASRTLPQPSSAWIDHV